MVESIPFRALGEPRVEWRLPVGVEAGPGAAR